MSTSDNDIVRRGYLNVVRNPQGGVIGRVLSVTSRRQWVVLRRENAGRPARIQLYRNEDQSVEPNKTLTLGGNSLRNIETLERKKAFVLVFQDESCMFQCSSRADMEDWYRDIYHYHSGQRGSISSTSGSLHGAVPNTGEIYEVIPDDETFRVRLRKAKSLAFSGPCLLEILRDFERNLFHIAMFTEEELPRLVVKWQIDHIRQYGSNNMAFKFESGSKSSTGVDWFIVDTEPGCAVRVHRAVDYWAKHIVEQVKNIPGGGGGRNNRRNTAPDTSIPDNNVLAKPHSRGSLGSTTESNNTYMKIDQRSMAPSSVYDAPQQSRVGPKPVRGGGKPQAPPPPNNDSTSTYMSLNPGSMDPSHNQTYEGLTPRNAPSGGRPPAVNGDSAAVPSPNNQLYMGIDPRTRELPEKTQYMGLRDARS